MSTDYIASHVPPQAGQLSANIKISFGLKANLTLSGQTPIVLIEALLDQPANKLGLILHSSQLLVLGDRGSRGEKVIDTTPVFWDLIRFAVENGPEALHNELPKDGRFFEQLIAGVYSEMGAKIVDLSPRSGDGGVDVWAIYELPGVGDVTIMDQVKLYRPDRDIKPGDILRILGGEQRGSRFSKAVVSTTGKFSPVDRKEVEGFGERVILRDAEVLKSVFEEALHHKDE